MSELAKRSLRERRTPKQFDEEVEDPDPYGYGRPPYAKDVRTPSQQINCDAKLLVRFINHANKGKITPIQALRDQEAEQRKRDIQNIKEPVAVRDRKSRLIQYSSEMPKRTVETVGIPRQELIKKQKEVYNFKPSSGYSEQLSQKNESFFNKIKTIAMQSASNMRLLQMTIAQNKNELDRSLPEKVDSVPKQPQNKGIQQEQRVGFQDQNGKASQMSQNSGFLGKDKQKIKKVHELQDKLGLQRTDLSSNNKIFKRSAYHVAICYHIYLKKLREKGPLGNQIDPTYHARRLKQEMSKNV